MHASKINKNIEKRRADVCFSFQINIFFKINSQDSQTITPLFFFPSELTISGLRDFFFKKKTMHDSQWTFEIVLKGL
jgi:hypothetical protein